MPNDAKLGLFAGVIGVIVAAVMAGNRPPGPAETGATTGKTAPQAEGKPAAPESRPTSETPESGAAPAPEPDPKVEPAVAAVPTPALAPAPVVFPRELPSTPVVRTKREPDATPTSRGAKGDGP